MSTPWSLSDLQQQLKRYYVVLQDTVSQRTNSAAPHARMSAAPNSEMHFTTEVLTAAANKAHSRVWSTRQRPCLFCGGQHLDIDCHKCSTVSYMQRARAPYLEGREYATMQAADSTNLPKTNIVSEHVFAQLDRFLQEKPNATTLALESLIMLGTDKTMAWLGTKSAEDQKEILQVARNLVPQHRALSQQRKLAIRKYRGDRIKQQQEKAQLQAQRHAQEVQKITAALSEIGGLCG